MGRNRQIGEYFRGVAGKPIDRQDHTNLEHFGKITSAIDDSDDLHHGFAPTVFVQEQVIPFHKHPKPWPDIVARNAHFRRLPQKLHLFVETEQQAVGGSRIVAG